MLNSTRYRGIAPSLVLAASGAGALAAPAAFADAPANASAGTSAKQSGQLEEIVVTATRHEESLSKVPISVTAMTQETLDQRGIKDFQDVVRFTPGVTIDSSGTNAISIRGISSSGGAGTTGIYIDDTPIQMRALGFNPDDTLPKTFDLDRVEVLRGPQGTLFGAGSEGGTVRYIMTQPSVNKESTYVRSEFSFTQGGQPSGEIGVAHGGPIIDDVLGYRASVWYRYDGGWIDRVDPNTGAVVDKNANRTNTIAMRLAFLYQPTDAVHITPSIMYQNSRKHDTGDFWPAYSNPSSDVFNNASPERMPVPDEYYLPALKIEADVGKTKIVSNTSYYHRDEITAYQGTVYDAAYFQSQSWLIGSCGPASSTPVPPCSWYPLIDANGLHLPASISNFSTPNQMTNTQRAWTEEIRWQSNDPTSAWTWTVGAFWSLSRETSIEELSDPNIFNEFNQLFGLTDPAQWFGTNNYTCNGANPGVVISFPGCDIYYNNNISHDRQLAGFGEVTYAFTDQWKLTLGGRYAKMAFDLSHYSDGYENYGPSYATAATTDTAFTPKLSIAFQADPSDLYYATYAKGFRPGGGNAPLPSYCNGETGGLAEVGYPNGAPLTYGPDTTQSYELGSKNNFDNRVRIATSVYYIKWNNIQQSVYVAGNCGLQFTDNLGTAVAKGFDIQAEMVLGGGVSVEAAFGYTDARYSKSTILYDTTQTPPVPHALALSGDAISGEAAIDGGPGTNPPWTLSLGAQYSFSIADKEAFVRADWEYTARNNWLAATQDPASAQYSPFTYTLSSTSFASLRGGVTLGGWQVAAFVDNLFNSHTITNYQISQLDANNPQYIANPGGVFGFASAQQNAFTWRPRTFGVTFTLRR